VLPDQGYHTSQGDRLVSRNGGMMINGGGGETEGTQRKMCSSVISCITNPI
jgi:hypothetical protein